MNIRQKEEITEYPVDIIPEIGYFYLISPLENAFELSHEQWPGYCSEMNNLIGKIFPVRCFDPNITYSKIETKPIIAFIDTWNYIWTTETVKIIKPLVQCAYTKILDHLIYRQRQQDDDTPF